MVEIQKLRYRLEEEQLARIEAERQLGERINDLLISKQNTREFGLFTEHSPQPILRFDEQGLLIIANPSAINLLGPKIEENAHISTLFPDCTSSWIASIIEQNQFLTLKFSVGEFHYLAYIKGVSDFKFINVYFNDITDLLKVKDEIEADKQRTEQLVQSISSILIGLDTNGRIMRMNAVAESVFGVQFRELQGLPLDECPFHWSLGTFDLICQLLEDEKSVAVEEGMFTNSDGKEGYMDATVTKILSHNEATIGYLILARDITSRKQLELQLNQAQKLESIGQLAAGIAHEINTPIQFIGDNTHFLSSAFQRLDKVFELMDQLVKHYKEGYETDDLIVQIEQISKTSKVAYMRTEIPFAIEESLKGLDQVASIVKGMKQFSHPGLGDKKLTDINSCLNNTITVSRNEWKYVADLELNFDTDLPFVLCHPNEMNQVFLNMIVNAAHAIEKKQQDGNKENGKITVQTTYEEDAVVIRISDTGVGIPRDLKAKIFDPFFTTKEPGKGTGQGLAIAHNVVYKHDGIITVDSEEGIGTTFSIRLPAEKQ